VIRRRQPLRRGALPPRRVPIKTRSEKRRQADRVRTQVRREVIERDGGCIMRAYGGCDTYGVPLDVDEIVSRGRGGDYLNPANCQTLCRRHHDLKHSRIHYASIIGLWGDAAMRLHVHNELGADFDLADEFELHERALRAYNERD